MSQMQFAINTVLPNPFQTRQSEDADHIHELANSIEEHGLLQIPLGRMSTTQPDCPELAFGHNRLSALKWLVGEGKTQFNTITIDIRHFSDVEMFELAVTENHDRKNLNPLEEAKAMLVYRETFDKNSDAIGELFHLSGSSVRNKMRLLELPEDIQSLVDSGKVTEATARELLSFYDMPEQIRNSQTYDYSNGGVLTLSESIEKGIKSGKLNYDDLKDKVDSIINRLTHELDKKPWRHDEVLLDTENKALPACKGCPNHLIRNKRELCMNPACYASKEIAWKTAYLTQASLLSGIPVLEHDDEKFKSHTQFVWGGEENLKTIRERGGCENLRLVYNPPNRDNTAKITNLVDEGFPNSMIVCMKKDGFCTCIKALREGIDTTPADGKQVSEAQLKEVRAQMKAKVQSGKAIVQDLVQKYSEALIKGLDGMNISLYLFLLKNAPAGFWWSNNLKEGTLEQVYEALAASIPQHQIQSDNPQGALRYINHNLEECGLEPLDIMLSESSAPEQDTPVPALNEQEEDMDSEEEPCDEYEYEEEVPELAEIQ